MSELLNWWMHSPNGRLARAIRNNIGSAYDVQALAMATFVQNASAALDLVSNDVRGRVDLQINATGSLPMEDGRSNSFGYHVGDAIQFLNLAAAVNGALRDLSETFCPRLTDSLRPTECFAQRATMLWCRRLSISSRTRTSEAVASSKCWTGLPLTAPTMAPTGRGR